MLFLSRKLQSWLACWLLPGGLVLFDALFLFIMFVLATKEVVVSLHGKVESSTCLVFPRISNLKSSLKFIGDRFTWSSLATQAFIV